MDKQLRQFKVSIPVSRLKLRGNQNLITAERHSHLPWTTFSTDNPFPQISDAGAKPYQEIPVTPLDSPVGTVNGQSPLLPYPVY